MWSAPIVLITEHADDVLKMPCVQEKQPIQALDPNRSHEAQDAPIPRSIAAPADGRAAQGPNSRSDRILRFTDDY
jgi:hypothetical protein